MKKVLFMSLALAVAMTGFAQRNVPVKAEQKTKVKWEQHKALGKEVAEESIQFAPTGSPVTAYYGNRYEVRADYDAIVTQMDQQSNSFVSNRMWRFDDGSIGVVTIAPSNGNDRGTGYNYYDGEEFGPQPETRIENIRTGWPSYCQYGANGEIVVAHTGSDLVYYTRATKGEGEWEGPNYIPNPSLGFPNEDLTWPRVVTSGPNHDIIHVICASQWSTDEGGDGSSYDFYAKSTDGENWEVTTVPTFGDEHFSADNYCLASNGNTVVMLYTGAYQEDAFIIKSTDNGETWTRTTIWDNPYSGMNWAEGGDVFFDETHTMYCPENGAVCIDNNGMVHCAFSIQEIANFAPEGQEFGCYVYSGPQVDGIFYWNENMGTLEPHDWVCPGDNWTYPADPHDVFRFWYPYEQPGTDPEGDHVTRNFDQNLIGFFAGYDSQTWVSDMFHHGDDYRAHWLGCSATPAICVDEGGIVAIAYSCIDPARVTEMAVQTKYPRSIYVSYIEPPYAIGDGQWEEGSQYNLTEQPGSYYINMEYLQDIEDEEFGFIHSGDEALWPNSITNAVNREFWFSFQADELVGINAFSGTQSAPSNNTLWVVKVVPDSQIIDGVEEEAVNPMTAVRVYPNPASDVLNIEVNASQASEMSINVYNIMGQNVMSKTTSINTGINRPSISTSELSSGIYFVTVKANGFENTMKFIVK
jgi:hypothetical protein